jgi:hypothetical protein
MKSLSVSIISIASVVGVGATSDFGGNNPSSSSPYFYSETFNVFEPENDVQDPYTESDDFSDSASVVASSLLYEGGCLVSSQAMMCNGGDSFITSIEFDSDQDFSDDEDDDEDDGHSSMLSNVSLRRSKSLADGSVSHPKADREPAQSARTTEYYVEEIRLNKQSSTQAAFMAGGKVFNDITRQKGISGLWDSFAPWGVVRAVPKGGIFGLARATDEGLRSKAASCVLDCSSCNQDPRISCI